MRTSSLRITASALLLSSAAFFLPGSASAFDATALIKQYQEAVAKQGQEFSYKSLENTGADSFSLNGVAWKIATIDPILAKSVVFSGIKENSDGTVLIGTMEATTITAGSSEVTVTFDNVLMKGLRIPAMGETDLLKQLPLYSRVEMGKGMVSLKGKTIATMGGAFVNVSDFNATTPMVMDSEIFGISFDTSAIPDPKVQQTISDLGYDGKFTGKVLMDASWSLSDGVMEISKYDFVIDNVGTLSMPFSFGGYTLELNQELQKMNKKLEGMSEEEKGMASLMAFKDLDLRYFTVSFKDDSITGRGIKYASKQMGQPAEQLTAAAPMMIGMGMGQLQMPELTAMVSDAVGKFLAKPGTISVSVKPEKPVPFMNIAAGSSDPKSLVKLLNLQVSAQ